MRGLGALVGLSAAALVLGSCTTSKDPARVAPAIPPKVLTSAQLRTALLKPADLGVNFHQGKRADGPNGTRCLAKLQIEDSLPRRAELTLYGGVQFGLPTIVEGIASLDDVRAAKDLMDRYRSVIAGCPHFDDHATRTPRIRESIRFEEDVPLLPVDDQIVMTSTGTVSAAPVVVPISLGYVVARIENTVIVVGFGDAPIHEKPRMAVGRVAISAVSRLRTLLAGKPQAQLAPAGLRVTEVQDVCALKRVHLC